VKRLRLCIQHGSGELHFFSGKLFRLDLIIEPVNLIFYHQHVKAAHFLNALPGAAFGIIAEIAFPDHCIVGAVKGMNVKGTLAVRDFPLEIEYCRLFVLAKRARDQQRQKQYKRCVLHDILSSVTANEKNLRQNFKLHAHAFVIPTADDGAYNFVFAGCGRCIDAEFLHALLKFKVPTGNPGVVFGAKKCEAMDGTITIPGFAFMGFNAKQERFACLHRNFRPALTGDFKMAVGIG